MEEERELRLTDVVECGTLNPSYDIAWFEESSRTLSERR